MKEKGFSSAPWMFWRSISMKALFPSLLISGTFNQQNWSDVLSFLGQLAFWVSIISASVILLSTFPKKQWLLILISCILLTKFARMFVGDVRSLVLIYSIFVGILFCFVGAVIAMEQRRLVYRQLIIILLICLPLMILQLAGVGEWTQILRGDAPADAKEQGPALFVSRADLNISVLQLRPAGLIWAPDFLSIILMFVLGLHFGNTKSRKINWNDVLLCAVIVLAMAKIVFLTLIFLTLALIFFGAKQKRRRAIKIFLLFLVFMAVYAYFFPGVFAVNVNWNSFLANFEVRKIDLSAAYRGEPLEGFTFLDSEGRPHVLNSEAGHESGYAQIAEILPYLIVFVLLFWFIYVKGLKKLNGFSPELKNKTVLMLGTMVLMPLITSFLEGAIFWLMAGFGLLPIFLIFNYKSFDLIFVRNEIKH